MSTDFENFDKRYLEEITELREALRVAQAQVDSFCMDYRIKCDAETKALQAKLSAIEAQEPVLVVGHVVSAEHDLVIGTKLYAAPVAPAQAQEPVVGTKTWFENGKLMVQDLTTSDIYKDPVAPTPQQNANAELVEALEEAKAGLEWYQAMYPESVDSSDDESMERIIAALANAKAAQPKGDAERQWRNPWEYDNGYRNGVGDATRFKEEEARAYKEAYFKLCNEIASMRAFTATPPIILESKAAQSLTKEQVEKVLGTLVEFSNLQLREHRLIDRSKFSSTGRDLISQLNEVVGRDLTNRINEAIEIMKGVRG